MPKAKKVVSAKKPHKKAKKSAKKVIRKSKKVHFMQKDYHVVTPCLTVNNAKKAIDFYVKVFGAKLKMIMEHAGRVMHSELKIGDSKIMLADECLEMHIYSPKHYNGSPTGIHLYVKDVDTVIKKAVSAGAILKRAPEDMFYGDRSGSVEDPFGHNWYIATHVEDVTPAKIRKRADALFNK